MLLKASSTVITMPKITNTEDLLNAQLERQRQACEEAICSLAKNGKKVAEFLRDEVTYRKQKK